MARKSLCVFALIIVVWPQSMRTAPLVALELGFCSQRLEQEADSGAFTSQHLTPCLYRMGSVGKFSAFPKKEVTVCFLTLLKLPNFMGGDSRKQLCYQLLLGRRVELIHLSLISCDDVPS